MRTGTSLERTLRAAQRRLAVLFAFAIPAPAAFGHGYFARAMDDWGPRVERFLVQVGAKR